MRSPVTVLSAAVLGAATWAAWLGWDHEPTYDPIADHVQDPYVTLQVVGCGVSVLLVVGLLAGGCAPWSAAGPPG